MAPNYPNVVLDEELAYRREMLEAAALKYGGGRRGPWLRLRRRPR